MRSGSCDGANCWTNSPHWMHSACRWISRKRGSSCCSSHGMVCTMQPAPMPPSRSLQTAAIHSCGTTASGYWDSPRAHGRSLRVPIPSFRCPSRRRPHGRKRASRRGCSRRGRSWQGWQRRTDQLHLSYAEFEGDLHQRPSRLLRTAPWRRVHPARSLRDRCRCLAGACRKHATRRCHPKSCCPATLNAGLRSLQLQQDCPFRAQAEMRLGATPLETPSDGIDPRLRGQLLHKSLELLWRELQGQCGAGTPSIPAHATRSCCAAGAALKRRFSTGSWCRWMRACARVKDGAANRCWHRCCCWNPERPPFTVVGIEERTLARVGRRRHPPASRPHRSAAGGQRAHHRLQGFATAGHRAR